MTHWTFFSADENYRAYWETTECDFCDMKDIACLTVTDHAGQNSISICRSCLNEIWKVEPR